MISWWKSRIGFLFGWFSHKTVHLPCFTYHQDVVRVYTNLQCSSSKWLYKSHLKNPSLIKWTCSGTFYPHLLPYIFPNPVYWSMFNCSLSAYARASSLMWCPIEPFDKIMLSGGFMGDTTSDPLITLRNIGLASRSYRTVSSHYLEV